MNREGKGLAVMAYTITDIPELVRYHFVFSEPDDERTDANLAQLVRQFEQMASHPLWREQSWVSCDRCGCSVDTDLIHPDGHHYADDGDFYEWTAGLAPTTKRPPPQRGHDPEPLRVDLPRPR